MTSKLDVLGFINQGETAVGIPNESRIHIGEFGEVGSGKSETLKTLMSQNINRAEGFLLIDPHGDMAREILGMIPKERWDDVVYVSLTSLSKFGRTIRINPLEIKSDAERTIIPMEVVSMFRNMYHEAGSWGDRLETILRNCCNGLVEIEGSTLGDIRRLVSDKKLREIMVQKMSSKNTKDFFTKTYEAYSKEAGTAVYNKLDKILATPAVAAMLDSPASTISFQEILDGGKIMIVDLSSGSTEDITRFVGSVILHMMYVEAKKRVDVNKELRTPFYVYLDEVHLFSTFAIREILNTMRKFGIKVTIATQTINNFPKHIADEMTGLLRTIVCFKCDFNTARAFENLLPVAKEQQTTMSQYTFSFFSQNLPPITGIAQTKPITKKEDWEPVALHSLKKYGETASLREYIPIIKKQGEYPDVTACESVILHLIKLENTAMTSEEIYQKINERFGAEKRFVFESIQILKRERYIEPRIERVEGRAVERFLLSSRAFNEIFSTTAMGRRAGSTLHLAAIFTIANFMQRQLKHSIPDLGDQRGQKPDLLIYEPATYRDTQSRTRYNLEMWDDTAYAVEVETDPTKHGSQIVINYKKNYEKGYEVWFAVFNEKHADYIHNTLKKENIDSKLYKIIQLNEEDVLNYYEQMDSKSSTHVSKLEYDILSNLESGASPEKIAGMMPVSAETVLNSMRSLEMKGMVEMGQVVTKKTKTSFKRNAVEKTPKIVTYAEKTGKGEKVIQANMNATELLNFDSETLIEFLKDKAFVNKEAIITILDNRGYRIAKNGESYKVYPPKQA